MAQTQPSSRARLEPPPSRPAVLSRLHHEQGAEHHLSRICSYSGRMKEAFEERQAPSLEFALQVAADSVRLVAHLSALKELELADARPQGEKQAAAPVLRTAARRKSA